MIDLHVMKDLLLRRQMLSTEYQFLKYIALEVSNPSIVSDFVGIWSTILKLGTKDFVHILIIYRTMLLRHRKNLTILIFFPHF